MGSDAPVTYHEIPDQSSHEPEHRKRDERRQHKAPRSQPQHTPQRPLAHPLGHVSVVKQDVAFVRRGQRVVVERIGVEVSDWCLPAGFP